MVRRLLQRARVRNNHGFSLLESFIAVILISVVGIVVAELARRNTMNLVWNRQMRKAAALADMVFEKYDYLASVSFNTLDQFNQSTATPSTFFVTGNNNQGYDGMYITTVAGPVTTNGNRQVTVTITWGAQTPQQTFQLIKNVAPGSGNTGGAPVYVYVLNNSGVGIPGFEVRAAHEYNPTYVNSIGTNEVIGFTDNNGYVVLNNVSTDPTLQPMPVYARKPGSDASISQASPNFVPGYYVSPNATWNNKTVNVSQTSANTVNFDMRNNDFRPLASLNGTLSNVGGTVINNMLIRLTANATNGSSSTITTPGTWNTYTSLTGYYEFNNIAPGAIGLNVLGHEGSDPTVPNTPSPPFDQGYVGFVANPVVSSAPWFIPMSMGDPALSISSYPVTVRPLGSLYLTSTDKYSGVPVASTTVSFRWPDIGYGDRGHTKSEMTSGPNGNVLQLFNMFAVDNQPIQFSASVPANGCTNLGYSLNNYTQNVWATINPPNNVNLPMIGGAEITGTVTDAASNPLGNMRVSVPGSGGGGGGSISATTSATPPVGAFTLCGVTPDTSTIRTWPLVPFTIASQAGGLTIDGTFTGSVIDSNYPSQTVPGMTIVPLFGGGGGGGGGFSTYVHNISCASDPNPTNTASDVIISNSLGGYGPVCEYIPGSGTVNQTVTGGPVVWNAGNVVFSTNSMTGGLTINTTDYSVTQSSRILVANGGSYSYNINVNLIEQEVSGVLTDAKSGFGIPGMNFDPCSGCTGQGVLRTCPVTTDAIGNYGPVWVCVTGRSNSNPGSVSVTVPNGLVAGNGVAYTGNTNTGNVTSPATPNTPVSINFSLHPKGGGI
jgi:Tfp pilus assembly protein PilV